MGGAPELKTNFVLAYLFWFCSIKLVVNTMPSHSQSIMGKFRGKGNGKLKPLLLLKCIDSITVLTEE